MKKLLVILFFISSIMFSQDEFVVNSTTESIQREPVIAHDGLGNYVIVWQSENQASVNSQGDIYFQMFSANGQADESETLVNTNIDFEQERPAVAMNSPGDFIIVWASHTGDADDIFDISAAIYRSPISSLPPRAEFKVNSTTLHSQTKPSVDMNDEGTSIVVWESWYQDGSDRGIYGQLLNSNGEKIGAEFLVNSTTEYSQARPTVKYFPNGNFIVIWESWKQDIATPDGYGIFGKIFDSDGNVIIDEFQINSYTNDYQWFGDVETFDDNTFAVVWCSWEQDGNDGGIYAKLFDQNAQVFVDETLINKTTVNYQWLPKINKMSNGDIAIVWSSWRQDGSREGVYAQILSGDFNKISFETQVNQYTESYQWEPDFIVTNDNQLLVTWSSWGQISDDMDYEIAARKISPQRSQAVISTKTFEHTAGTSTTRFYVHIVDSTQLTGDDYEITFNVLGEETAYAAINNTTTSTTVVDNFPLNSGEGVFYLTPIFEGVAVEFQPVFKFELDTDNSYFVNNSGTNLNFSIGSGLGVSDLQPIDVAVIWGDTETNPDGSYVSPLDSAYNQTGQKIVKTPFYAWSITTSERLDLVIIEPNPTANEKWDPGENIGILIPDWQSAGVKYHASLNATFTPPLVLPGPQDTNYIFTRRPITSDDKFTFTTDKAFITTDLLTETLNPVEFKLEQNYPNPFNPTTTIAYSIPKKGDIELSVFNILGEKVATLFKGVKERGNYRTLFNQNGLASGVYFYNIKFDNRSITKKMLLLK